MNIRHYIYTAFAATAVLSFAACDEIAEDERFIETTPVLSDRAILVEEFSGQLCVNCPDGAVILSDIHDMYAKDFGRDVIVVSIHCGSKKRPPLGVHETNTATLGLATDFGEALYAKYNSPALPAAVFDRTTNPIEDMKTWMTPIGEAFKRSTSLSLTLNAVYSPADSTINVTLSGQSSLDLQGNVHVWLTEDDIVAMQMLKPEDRPAFGGQTYNYEHQFNHIFRAAITPMEGEPINFAWNDAEPVSKSYSIAVDSKWNVNNMTVVAFVDNATGVCQATKAPVVAEANK